ncbi:Rrn6p NDAI_0H00570 [Naumovozyma dairenensis CBS 421]|uniref:RNA polymerase I-specific transcription initiation factor RRN6 n=1 Tax=Naumovozyma dairenensis (strain ATCC 10597 / BCRC 20456 / CBS 421 / NBRC 0211 / NRRL Y-12639) TaxID=1071378 RepID=G0WEM0_NAUDC|nr:hypothetical protein NDAI_0H00570 [Naumovozyma dairenensis CBS 421]CCD26231.1 hypothetical protein NDAI_0H00570 [Naumovozyma dairenensis CBS 421]
MNHIKLPYNRRNGAQLGIGIESPSLYLPETIKPPQKDLKSNSPWLKSQLHDIPATIPKLTSSLKPSIIELQDADMPDQSVITSSSRSDLDNDSTILTDDNHMFWESILASRRNWGPLSPRVTSDIQIYPSVISNIDLSYQIKEATPVSTHPFVPRDVISSSKRKDTKHERNKNSTGLLKTFDPIVGDLIDVGIIQTLNDIRKGVDGTEIIVYVCGNTSSTLCISRYTDDSSYLLPTYINLQSPIKNIKIGRLSKNMLRASDCIGILTENSFYVLKLHQLHDPESNLSYILYGPLTFNEFNDFTFADFAFNPWDIEEFALVDIKGNWIIGSIPKLNKHAATGKLFLKRHFSGTIFDIEEQSRWKKIEWSLSSSRILILNRSQMVEVDYRENWQLQIIEAKTWSRLRDYKRVDDTISVLLTSREIIIISTKDNDGDLKRELSWKHDLDPSDCTIRMFIQRRREPTVNLFSMFITSKRHNKVYVHVFSIDSDDKILQSYDESKLLNIPGLENGIDSIAFEYLGQDTYEGNATEPVQREYKMFIRNNDDLKVLVFLVNSSVLPDQEQEHISDSDLKLAEGSTVPDTYSDNLLSLFTELDNKLNDDKVPAYAVEEEGDIFQEYGYRLSDKMNQYLENAFAVTRESVLPFDLCLKVEDLTDVPGYIHDFSEFESLLDQFFQYYNDQDVTFTDIKGIFQLLLGENIANLDLVYNKLLQCWVLASEDAKYLTKEVLKNVIWASLRFSKRSNYDTYETEIYRTLDDSYRSVIDSWDNLSDLENEHEVNSSRSTLPLHSQPQFSFNSQSQIPTIKSSQTRSQRSSIRPKSNRVNKTKSSNGFSASQDPRQFSQMSSQLTNSISSTLPDTMTPAFTLMQPVSTLSAGSSGTPIGSQSRSSQRGKKKKKKVGGFG